MNYFIQDLNVFYATIYGGILIGILFDINRSLKNNFKFISKLSFVFDVLFWLIITVIIFIVVNTVSKFQLRYYHFIALAVGFILYYNTISKFILKFNNMVINFIKSLIKKIILTSVAILENLYYVIVYAIHFLFDMIFYIPNIIFKIKKNTSRRPLVKKKMKKGV
ncbi:spore cortex biosynthesis protein YabQ [Intestinibacter bartlettii]|uniref:Spore cortex biosynthesis protein YabQ n=1 Tax=Intestinibacter bartlettii TaxID=261299 RepID=A0ABS6DWT3_9FIRM|nr:spore cortex biosynthesis protein YabQ [Intestinibacter bartlettii]MBU5336311.1 spore cortex biosynthesis protein YabQ [Intestinibacter bartlettii]MDO5009472.1 spore cortex biosynthesis protein YabQ [Intestinibacter bartlettii]